MKLTRLIPIASLTTVGGVALTALVLDRPADFPFTEPPAGDAPAAPSLGVEDGVLFGRVVDGSGAPLAEAGVVTRGGPRPSFARTRADGTFELDGLSAGGGRLLVIARGFESTRIDLDEWPVTDAGSRLAVTVDRPIDPAPDPEGLDLMDLEGRVDLGPLAHEGGGYELYFLPEIPADQASGGFPRRTDLEPSGRFVVADLQKGAYSVLLLGPDDRGGVEPDLLSGPDGAPRSYLHGAGDGVRMLELVATAGAVRGVVRRVVDGDDPAARPAVRGAFVRLERILALGPDGAPLRTDPTHFRATRTDAEGAFVARDLVPGRYRVSVFAGRANQEATVEVEARSVARTEVLLGADPRAALEGGR